MDKVLSVISGYVSTCASCRLGYEGKCGFIIPEANVSTENNPYDHEEYRKLTYQQRAFRKEQECSHPCDEQITFAAIIDKVEEELEEVKVDYNTKTVLKYLTKIDNITKSLERQPIYLWFAFEDIVMTCLERCLAHIDYGFLEAHIDIEEAILSIFPDYKRKEALCIAHPEAFINTYLSQATKIPLDRMLSTSGDLRITRQDIEDAESAAEMYEASIDRSALLPPAREFNGSAIKELKYLLGHSSNMTIIGAIKLALGYSPQRFFNPDFENGDIELAEQMVAESLDKHFGRFARWKICVDELKDVIVRNLFDDIQLKRHIRAFIHIANDVASSFFPKTEADVDDKELAIALNVMANIKMESLEAFCEVWKKSKDEASLRRIIDSLSEEEYLDALYRIAYDNAKEEEKVVDHNVFTYIHYLKENITDTAIALDGCLIEVCKSRLYRTLENEIGVTLNPHITRDDYFTFFAWTDKELRQYFPDEFPSNPIDDEEAEELPFSEDSLSDINEDDLPQEVLETKCPPIKFELAEPIKDLVSSIPHLIKDSVWQGTDLKEYAIFMKALSMVSFGLGEKENIRWKDLPVYQMLNGKTPTRNELRAAMRRYKHAKDSGKFNTYLKTLNEISRR